MEENEFLAEQMNEILSPYIAETTSFEINLPAMYSNDFNIHQTKDTDECC